MIQPLLTIENLSKTYDGKKVVLQDIQCNVYAGELVAVIGSSGAGKSTLMRCINRMVEPTQGTVVFDGKNVCLARGRALKKIRARIGMIFQHYNLIGRTNVLNNVLHGRLGETPFYKSMFGLYAKEDKIEAKKLIQTVGLTEQMHQKAGTLSGGQMQRVGIARALMQRPKLLLADEPIASLDPASSTAVMNYLKAAVDDRGLACVVNLHQVEFAKKYATRIVGMKDGIIVFDGKPEDLTDAMVQFIYGHDEGTDDDGKIHPSAPHTTDEHTATQPSMQCVHAEPMNTMAATKPAHRTYGTAFQSTHNMPSIMTRTHFLIAMLALIVMFSFVYLRVSPVAVFAAFPSFIRFFNHNFLPPNFTGIAGQLPIVWRTLMFAVVGTYISAILAFIFGLLMARETNSITPLRVFIRFIVSFLRNVPLLVWGTVLVFIFGIGSMLGVVALVMATLGFLSRSYADSIDEIAGNKLEALKANGAGRIQIMFHGLIPEFIPAWINWTLFSFEINIRASAVLGMVGAGGLGLLIQTNLDLRSFRRAMALIIILTVMVLVTEIVVNLLRTLMQRYARMNMKPLTEKLSQTVLVTCLVLILIGSARYLDLNLSLFAERFMNNVFVVVPRLMAFNSSILPDVFHQLIISMLIGICALTLGMAVSFVLSFLAARNTTPYMPLGLFIKSIISIIRAVPSLVLILMFVASLGFGYIIAVVGLMFSSIGYLTKAFTASIEDVDFGIIEAMRATGAGRIQVIMHGLVPCCITAFISWVSIRLESNISDSISIGIVGAGGVGMLIARANRQLNFADLSTILLVIFAAMLLIEFATGRLRRTLSH